MQSDAPVARSYALEAPEVGGAEALSPGLTAEELSVGFQDALRLGESPLGDEVFLSDYLGNVVLVSYWTSSCASCWEHIVDLQRSYDVYRQRGLVVVLVNRGDEAQLINEYLNAKNQVLTLEMVLDRDGQAAAAPAIVDLPAAVLYGGDGREIARYTNGVDMGVLQRRLDELL